MPQQVTATAHVIEPTDWYVVWEGDESKPTHLAWPMAPWWVRMFQHRDARHVWAMRPGYNGFGIITTQTIGRMLLVDWAPVDIEQAIAAAEARGFCVRLVAGRAIWCYRPRVMLSCVTAVKALLGIEAPLVWTPRQLYRYCERRELFREGQRWKQ